MTENDIYFSRAGKSHNLSMGIVGLPNVGKSTLFNALTQQNVLALNYPFCTIDPSEGRLLIQDERLTRLAEIYKPKNIVPAYLTVYDIAGLIRNASVGEGLGNNFLEHIRQVDGIFHVVRCFEDISVVHTEESIDAMRDVTIIDTELRLKDKEFVKKKIEKYEKEMRSKSGDKKIMAEKACLDKLDEILSETWVLKRKDMFNAEDVKFINSLNLLTTKNVVYLANISEEEYLSKRLNVHVRNLTKLGQVIPFSAEYESKNAGPTRFKDKLVKNGYVALNLINYFTAGRDEVKSWTIRTNTKAPQAGRIIHTDFENYFIMAEVFNYTDIDALGSEAEVKKAGKYHQRGKMYVVEDGDVILFKHNPPKTGKKSKK
ncbi:hypothetical protein BDAP_000891 [Binucleata daphniae]